MPRARYLNKKTLQEALRIFVDDLPLHPSPPEVVAAEDALGRVTAEAVCARVSVPHYHGSAMDGIAVRAQDTFGASDAAPVELERATQPTDGVRVFAPVDTGHPLPPWANAVIMIEHVYPLDAARVAIRAAALPWQHVRLVGEDVVAGETLLPRGHRIRPFDIGALLATGHLTVPVARRPTVAIFPTGTELVEPGEPLEPGAIVEFNSRVVAGFVAEWGGIASRQPRLRDDLADIQAAIAAAVHRYDIVVVIAGSSAGEHDYTVRALGTLGTVLAHGIDIMPGKPAICAVVDGTPVLGLPGYPVSAAIVCQQLLRPLLAKHLGAASEAPHAIRAVVPRKLPSKLGLEEFVRVTVGRVGDRLLAQPLGRGAGAISTLVRADGFLRIPTLSEGTNAGDEVTVELLRPAEDIEHTIVFSGSHDLTISVLEDCLKRRVAALKIAANNVGSLGGLLAMKRGEAHVCGTHLLDPKTGAYNLPDIRRLLGARSHVVVVNLAVREQGLLVAKGNPKNIGGLRDLVRDDVTFVNRQPGAGTRVLLDYHLRKARISATRIRGYEREEFTHMAVAVTVASGLADCGLGIRSAAVALDLDFIPVAQEDYDLVLRADFAAGATGQLMLDVLRSTEFRQAAATLGGYRMDHTGTVKALQTTSARQRIRAPRKRPALPARRSSSARRQP